MGRKPNPLILEYFNRGPKLEDASNRYQHTCKSCGERFPKGRIDSLQTHLTRKCPSLSAQERRKIILRVHDACTPADLEPTMLPHSTTHLDHGKHIKLPFSPSRQFDRLNVLAEASRQVGATDPTRPKTYEAASQSDGKGIVVDPALEVDDFLNHAEYYSTKSNSEFVLPQLCWWLS